VLEALLRSRKVSHPDDEDLEYYQAVLEIERGQFPQALQRLLASREPKDDEDEEAVDSDLAMRMRWLRLDIYEKYDEWQKALQQDPVAAIGAAILATAKVAKAPRAPGHAHPSQRRRRSTRPL
jgi:hypothetical protein